MIEKAHTALGLSFAAGEKTTQAAPKSTKPQTETPTAGEKQAAKAQDLLQDPKVPNVKVVQKEKTKKVFGETTEGKVQEAEENAANRDFGKIDKVRVV